MDLPLLFFVYKYVNLEATLSCFSLIRINEIFFYESDFKPNKKKDLLNRSTILELLLLKFFFFKHFFLVKIYFSLLIMMNGKVSQIEEMFFFYK